MSSWGVTGCMCMHALTCSCVSFFLASFFLFRCLLVLLSGQITISSGESRWGDNLCCQCSSFRLHRRLWGQQRQWCAKADLVPMERWRADEGLYALKFWGCWWH